MTIEPGSVLQARELGVTVEVRATSASTGGAYVEFDVVGRLAELSATGGYDRFGMPKPRSAARLVRDFAEHRALARALLRGGR